MRVFITLLAIAILIALIAILVMLILRPIAGAIKSRRDAKCPWELEEESTGEAVEIYAAKPGEKPLLIGYARFSDPQFDSKLYELRSEGKERIYALNS